MDLYKQLQQEFNSSKPDLSKCSALLAKLKIAMIEQNFLDPTEKFDEKTLLMARDVLEIGALVSIRNKDIASFERYMSQLKTYYNDYARLPPSPRLHQLLGLNLLRLLAQNRISDFHTELETIDPDQLDNQFIRHPMQVEQCLMEGSYNKVWNSREKVPAPEYAIFMDILMNTIRNEIASCSEHAYTSLPITDAATLLHFKSQDEFLAFAKQRGWTLDASSKRVKFESEDNNSAEIPRDKVLNMMIGYARELERIV